MAATGKVVQIEIDETRQVLWLLTDVGNVYRQHYDPTTETLAIKAITLPPAITPATAPE